MTEEQKKAIDACKDQAAKEKGFDSYAHFEQARRGKTFYHSDRTEIEYRAIQLYGEQCQSELIDLLKDLDEYFYHNDCRGAAPFMEKIESILQKAKIPTESEKDGLP